MVKKKTVKTKKIDSNADFYCKIWNVSIVLGFLVSITQQARHILLITRYGFWEFLFNLAISLLVVALKTLIFTLILFFAVKVIMYFLPKTSV